METPVTFYLWAHNCVEELMTPIFESSLATTDVLFYELVSNNDTVDEIEHDFNAYIATGDLTEKLRGTIAGSHVNFVAKYLLDCMRETGKRILFERSPAIFGPGPE